ncbi:GAF domain-containing protein [Minwuia thermotolerans]|uniref:Adenylate/guanylate cyclase domain-containing protein n=1 Tax=Minwuia thermotolerans TaxID=2056226 RepID=A0A2M9G7D1_9PROT|nr:GAF domain-containing protein [Minwuia thermotolerans]PJK31586.1 adenylate/guanylate cyclase domain-containing protein [Minwuia thermotolerans]
MYENPRGTRKNQNLSQSEHIKQLQMLLDVSRQVAALDTLDAVLDTLVSVAVAETKAERGTLFLHDAMTGELFSRVAQGLKRHEIRILDNVGIAGHTFQSGEGQIIHDAYNDERFNRDVDAETGFTTKSILAAPVRNAKGEVIGVAQVLNKKEGQFTEMDLTVLEGMTTQCAITLQSMQLVERMETTRQREIEFLNIVSDMTSELELTRLLQRVMSEATRMLDAERSTLFINDEKTNELFSHVGEGLDSVEIRLPNHLGIAGAVFTSGDTVNIPYAYADLRFNPGFDKQTGFFTRSILCVPVVNKAGKVIGVTQALNKKGGPFTSDDESRLKAFTAQIAIGLENAKLFGDVQAMKNYNESMLQSMSNGVITFDEDGENKTCNAAGARIMRTSAKDILGKKPEEVFGEQNQWLVDKIARVAETDEGESMLDTELKIGDEKASVNVTVLPMQSGEGASLGTLVMIEDISDAKRARSTLSRYMDPGLADQMLAGGNQDDILGGKDTIATVLFSDVRSFTTITEKLGAQGTVALLNDYFELMVDCISDQGGMLDKFIGDAIMAAFGIPLPHEDDEDRGLRAGINMIKTLWDWNRQREARGEMAVDMGLGLNTDSIVAGNIGSKKRMDYTMIGDGVNLAARLESACKQYNARILLSEYTVAKLKGVYRLREVDKVVVKGKTKPVGVFECLDYHTDETFPNLMDVLGNFNEGVKQYRKQEWDRATGYFREALKANETDKLGNMYIERCELMKKAPPGDDWDGVWIMTEK